MKTLLVFAFIQLILQMTSADWEHPNYSYRCLENGGVELFGVHNESSIEVDGKVNGKPCIYHYKTTKPGGVYAIQPQCLTNKFNATISVYDKVFDGISGPLTTTTTTGPKIIGGHVGHKFVITCEDIPETGINRTVAHVFQEKEYKELPDNYKEVSNVEMRFKAVDNPAAPDISTVYIGDEFYMFINYTGKQPYTVIPEECTAFGETWISKGLNKSGHSIVALWSIDKYSNSSPKACVEHKELLEGFGRYSEKLIYTKMYGFRFKDKDYVTITCQVKIFNRISVSDNTNLCMAIPTNTEAGRRKRNIENVPFQTKALTKRLRVFDNKDVYLAENKGQKIKWETSLWMMIFATVTLHTWLANS